MAVAVVVEGRVVVVVRVVVSVEAVACLDRAAASVGDFVVDTAVPGHARRRFQDHPFPRILADVQPAEVPPAAAES